jgi:acid phosphatase (class A)
VKPIPFHGLTQRAHARGVIGLVGGLLLLSASFAPLRAADDSLHYLAGNRPDALAILPPPPTMDSPEQAADMATVVAVHGACTPPEAVVAFSEKNFDVFTFAPAVGPFFTATNLPKTAVFFEQVLSDAAAVTDEAKDLFKRPRPFVVDPSLASGKLEKSFSYPSGHSTEATVLSLVLADLLPDKKDAIQAEGRALGWHRIQIARHYPSDIYAGRFYARTIFNDLKASPQYQKDFAAAQAEILAVQAAARN